MNDNFTSIFAQQLGISESEARQMIQDHLKQRGVSEISHLSKLPDLGTFFFQKFPKTQKYTLPGCLFDIVFTADDLPKGHVEIIFRFQFAKVQCVGSVIVKGKADQIEARLNKSSGIFTLRARIRPDMKYTTNTTKESVIPFLGEIIT